MNIKSYGRVMTVILVMIVFSMPVLGFPFVHPEIKLVETDVEDSYKADVSAVFDAGGNVHAAWTDGRVPGSTELYGNTVLRDRNPMGSYLVFGDQTGEYYASPVMLSSQFNPAVLYVVGARISSDPNAIIVARYDLNLPYSVNPVAVTIMPLPLMGGFITDLQAVWTDHMISFAFVYNNQIHTGGYDTVLGNSSYGGIVSVPGSNEMSNISLAADTPGYIYLAYNRYDQVAFQHSLVIRRSFQVNTLADGFEPQRQVAWDIFPFRPVIAATGNRDINNNLRVSIGHYPEGGTIFPMICVTEINGPWGSGSNFGTYSTDVTWGVFPFHAMDISYDKAGRLYVIWEQDDWLFGSISYDTGVMFSATNALGPVDVEGRISLALGNTPGNVAVSYSRYDWASYAVPFVLVSMSDIYDSCDQHPSATGFWDGYSGVSLDTTLYHGNSASIWNINPASYRLTTESLKSGAGLLRDFGSDEHQGVLELHLQDSLTTEADFTIIFENDNAKGVIRMLGVQNDESYDDFLYHDGIQWVKVADRDVAGWYHIIVVVNDAGTLVSIETEPESGIYDMYLDPSFTSFTSIRIVGGSVSDPFNVDDIRVETVPVEGFPPIVPIPVDSWITILIMISVIGVILTRMR